MRYILQLLFFVTSFMFATESNLDSVYALAKERELRYLSANAQEIIPISSHHDLLKTVQNDVADNQTAKRFCVFDLDDCITCPKHAACLPHSYRLEHAQTFKDLTKDLTPVELSILWNLKYVEPDNCLTEDDFACTLNKLHKLGLKTMGLTASQAGRLKSKDIYNFEDKSNIMDRLGIQFNTPQQTFKMNTFPLFHGAYPTYHKGIAFSQTSIHFGSASKGEVLEHLLKKWNLNPDIVYYVDDSLHNLHIISYHLAQMKIAHKTFLYRSAVVHLPQTITKDAYIFYIQNLINKARFAAKFL